MQEQNELQGAQPPQHQERQPGIESEMTPRPAYEGEQQDVFSKLAGKVAIITGGDSGIGRAVAVAFAREGADVVVSYLDEHEDAKETKWQVEREGQKCLLIAGDISTEAHCIDIVEKAVGEFGRLDIVVNNAAVQYPQENLEDITEEQLVKTFRTNIFPHFFLTKAALKYLQKGSAIINTTSVTAYRGSSHLIDYASTKGAIVGFTRSLSSTLASRGIRVNAVAPGPIWTPLIPASFPEEHVATFGTDVPMKRAGQPEEVATCYVFLASVDSSYMTGQVLHPNGGEIING
ncbi:SDR family oxidoreductase [Arcticibacter tournemirensis]|uniref:SDR family oxidoreductase n=1 Tax=Arcticibacter tournemirensis TaxID=699437 RepID=A0A4Q0MFS7_9SPHI|nr:SDR family oxidoreductase [Arcticibacter tournemirensis]RXF72360.1 SDR family oxidoreductase [Arcticibacter tournemirensis]